MLHVIARVAQRLSSAGIVLLMMIGSASAQPQDRPLQVVATVPELGSLAREIGGDEVRVTVIAKGTEDPHFVEAKPSFVKAVHQADVFIQMGLDMEVGWAPVLLQQGRNLKVQPGKPGFVDAARVVSPLGVLAGSVDRSMGDVHPAGNPHFLLDPMRGLQVAAYLRHQFSVLRPSRQGVFAQRYADFRWRLGQKMVGTELADKYDFEKLVLLFAHGKLLSFLQSQQESQLLGGWLGAVAPFVDTKAVDDHDMWLYFAERFQVDIIGHMEPKPGVPPTTRHLKALIKTMRAQDVPLILTGAYYDPRHARFLAQHTAAKVAEMANQVGSRPGTDDYLRMIDYNVKTYVTTLASG